MPGECEDSNRLPNEAGESTERDVETMGLACGVDPSGMASKGNHGKWLAMHCLGFGACWGVGPYCIFLNDFLGEYGRATQHDRLAGECVCERLRHGCPGDFLGGTRPPKTSTRARYGIGINYCLGNYRSRFCSNSARLLNLVCVSDVGRWNGGAPSPLG